MGRIIRTISADASVVASAIDATDIVAEIEKIHQTSAVVTAALGRLTIAASLMGFSLKGKDDSLTLRINGNGPAGGLIAVSDSMGNVKSYVDNPIVELPLNNKGKLDVAGAVGTDGTLAIIKDFGLKEPYVGQIAIVSGEIAEDITNYFAVSEQTPTVCALGVLVNPDLSVKKAGGYLIQLLPFADENTISIIEKNIENILSVTQMLSMGMTPENIAMKILEGLDPNVLDDFQVEYKCDCNKERVERALISTGESALIDMAKDPTTHVECHFCNKSYSFSPEEVLNLIQK